MTKQGSSFSYKRAGSAADDGDIKRILRESEERVRDFLERYQGHASTEHRVKAAKGEKRGARR